MRKEAKTLHSKAVDSLVLAVDHFNRAWDRGRTEAVLILLDRAFELMLKAIIVHKAGGAAIREKKKEGTTIGFDLCLRKCLTDAAVKCLSEDEVVALQTLNTLRDAAQHYMLELSEEQLYVYAQSALTLFGRLAKDALGRGLSADIPQRILPVCAKPPRELSTLFAVEFADIKKMVRPGSRRRLDAKARLRSMAILQASLEGKKTQPSDSELDKILVLINKGQSWQEIFPGITTLSLEHSEDGYDLAIRVTKKEGEAVRIVPEGTTDATVVAVRRVNELDFYNLGARDLAKKLSVNETHLIWYIKKEKMQDNPDFFKVIEVGRSPFKRYSGKAYEVLRDKFLNENLADMWKNHKAAQGRSASVNQVIGSGSAPKG